MSSRGRIFNPLSAPYSPSVSVRLHAIFPAVDDLMKDLEGSASSPLTHERRLGIYDKVFVALQDAKKHVRDDLVRTFAVLFLCTFLPSFLAFLVAKLRRSLSRYLVFIPSP